MTGFIKLHRGWRDCEVFASETLTEREAWLWLIENAAWKPTRARVKGSYIEIGRGELTFSVRFMAEKWDWSKSRVDRFLAKLKAAGMVETRTKSGTTAGHNAGQGQNILTICNYEKYQSDTDTQRDNDVPEVGQQRDKEEELKEKKKDNTRVFGVDKPAEVEPRVWADFQAVRKAKRAPLTETALASIEREASKAGWPLNAALTECVARGWQAFKAEWVVAVNDQAESAKAGSVW